MRHAVFIFVGLIIGYYAAAIPAGLKKSNIIVRSGTLILFGFDETGERVQFRCLSYDSQLSPIDSFSLDLGKGKADQYHEIGTDTLHCFFNFWFQKVDDEKTALYLRLNQNLRQVFVNDKAEAARINSVFIYDEDKIQYKNRMYVIRSPRDSAHKFFLSCYELKSDQSFFDYNIKWGFRFYKFNYLRCKLLMADNEKVLVYVHALDGEKKGQYILSINASNGELLRSTQFNDEDASVPVSYFFSRLAYNTSRKEYFASGTITKAGEEAQLLNPKKAPQLFFIVLNERAEIKYRINDLAVLPKSATSIKDMKYVCVRTKDIHVTETGQTEIISEVAGSADGKKFRPYGYWLVSFTYVDGVKSVTVNQFYNLIDDKANKLVTRNPGDINGSFIIKGSGEHDKTLFMDHMQEVVTGVRAEGAGIHLLARRKETLAKKVIFMQLKFPYGAKLEQQTLFDALTDDSPVCVVLDRYNAIIFAKSKTEGLILKKIGW